MTKWLIKFRAPEGVTIMIADGDTQEEAETFFRSQLFELDIEFGAILTITPSDPLAHPEG